MLYQIVVRTCAGILGAIALTHTTNAYAQTVTYTFDSSSFPQWGETTPFINAAPDQGAPGFRLDVSTETDPNGFHSIFKFLSYSPPHEARGRFQTA